MNGRYARAERVTEPTRIDEDWEELERLYRQALDVLAGLDRLQLYQAGAYLSMSLEIIRQRHPLLSPSDADSPRSSPPPAPSG